MNGSAAPPEGDLLPLSPSQTIGPFFHDVAVHLGSNAVAGADTSGARIRIEGRVLDGAGEPVDDALVEIWQPHLAGAGGEGAGFARSETADAGRFWFDAVKPDGPAEGSAPFIPVRVFARGLLRDLLTRIYFDDARNATDPVLQALDPERRATLIAVREAAGDPPTWRFDIRLQGEGETVFFELQHEPR